MGTGTSAEFRPPGMSDLTDAERSLGVYSRSMNQQLADYLNSLSADELVKLISEQADANDQFMHRLIAASQLASGEKPDLAAWKKRVTAAYGRGFIDYRQAPGWASNVLAVLESVSDINDAGHHRSAMSLAEHAHKRTETAVNRIDDSNGWITSIFHEIARIHLDACLASGAGGPKLAQRLVKLELSAELDTFHRSAVSYAEALGDDGLAEYGRLVSKAADELPPGNSWFGPRFRVQEAQLAHAIASREPDRVIDLVTANREDARQGFGRNDGGLVASDYHEIADALVANGRDDEALAWVTLGTAELKDWSTHVGGLRDLRAEMLRARGEDGEVAAMYWHAFKDSPRTSSYQLAVEAAPDAALARAEAIEHVVGLLGEPKDYHVGRPHHDAKIIGVIEVLVAAEDLDEAWIVACQYGAPLQLWDDLAEYRKDTNIDDAVTLWMLRVNEQIDKRQKKYYRKAARLLKPIKVECEAAGKLDLYETLVDQIRLGHANRPSLLRELAAS